MTGEYTIVKCANSTLGSGLPALEAKVRALVADGWRPLGGPFHEPGLDQWCQALERSPIQPTPPDVQLREPGPALPPVAPGMVHTHGSPTDNPLRMREPKRKP